MRTVLAVGVVVLYAAGLAAQDKKYEKDGKFTAKFPNNPAQQTKSAAGLTVNVIVSDHDKGKGGFMVAYADLPAELIKAPKPEQVLESGRKALEDDFKLKNVKSDPTMFGPKKFPARTISGDRDEVALRGTVVLVGGRLYQVYVFGQKDFVMSKDATDFLASFTITD